MAGTRTSQQEKSLSDTFTAHATLVDFLNCFCSLPVVCQRSCFTTIATVSPILTPTKAACMSGFFLTVSLLCVSSAILLSSAVSSFTISDLGFPQMLLFHRVLGSSVHGVCSSPSRLLNFFSSMICPSWVKQNSF